MLRSGDIAKNTYIASVQSKIPSNFFGHYGKIKLVTYLAMPNSTIEGSSIDIIVGSDGEFAIAMLESVVKFT